MQKKDWDMHQDQASLARQGGGWRYKLHSLLETLLFSRLLRNAAPWPETWGSSRAVDPKTNMCVTVCVVVSVWLFLGSMFVVHSRVV